MKKRFALLLSLTLCLALSACVGTQANPLVGAEATDAPGTAPALHAAAASESNVQNYAVTLYFRYADQPYLAAETRTLAVRRDQTLEYAIVEALLNGPDARNPALQALLPETAGVLDVSAVGDTLFVTFSMALLTGDGIPADWAQQEERADEAPLRRQLAAASLVCSLTENTGYTAVQIMVQQDGNAQGSFRLDKSYFLGGETGPSEPMTRHEAWLSTPYQTARRALYAWQQWDADALYALIAGDAPERLDFSERLDHARSMVEFTVSEGSVSPELGAAVVCVTLRTADAYGETQETRAFPLRLTYENGVWKIPYDTLLLLLSK